MNRMFNAKKIIKDMPNDRNTLVIGDEIIFDAKIESKRHQRTAIRIVEKVFIDSSFGGLEIACNRFEEDSNGYATCSLRSNANEAGFVTSLAYVRKMMNPMFM